MNKPQNNFLEMYKNLGLLAGQAISPQAFGNLQYKYLSPTDRRDIEEIIKSFIKDGYIDEDCKLSKKGEDFLYA